MSSSPGGLGIAQLDALLAPIPLGTTLALVNDPGVEPEPFLHQAAHRRLAAGGEVVYMLTARGPGALRSAMAAHGFDPLPHGARLRVADLCSPLLGRSEGAPYELADPADLGRVAALLERAAREHPAALLVLEGLSTLADHAGEEAFEAAMPRLHVALRRFGVAIAQFTRWPYADPARLLQGFHGLVALRGVEDRVRFGTYFAAERAAWVADLDTAPRLYKVARPGGVVVYVPKVLVTGPHNAGKTSFVHSAAEGARSAEVGGTTVALDHGTATIDGLEAELFGTPGQERFDPLLKTLAGQALGVIVVVDSTDPASFPRARDMLQRVWTQGLPAILAANKQDVPGALPAAAVERGVAPPQGVRALPCRATDPAEARHVLAALLDQILRTPPPLQEVAP
ncbi:MAG TPA: ATP/GTP-binding protein [Candidatus Thermoplasmatota archaeon]|jgi:hypothetical protein|nr:ATP/GTP-binding protein [Candidatus Thermoplasmatota archaeon]